MHRKSAEVAEAVADIKQVAAEAVVLLVMTEIQTSQLCLNRSRLVDASEQGGLGVTVARDNKTRPLTPRIHLQQDKVN